MSELQAGQLVIVANHRPYYGRSLDGTLGRLTERNKGYRFPGSDSLYVELYRRHKTTGRPLGLREELMRESELLPIAEGVLTEAQRDLITHFQTVKLEQMAHRAALRSKNLKWENDMLARAGLAPTTIITLSEEQQGRVAAAVHVGVSELERLLKDKPPEGTNRARVDEIFDRHREHFTGLLIKLASQTLAEILTRRQQRSTAK